MDAGEGPSLLTLDTPMHANGRPVSYTHLDVYKRQVERRCLVAVWAALVTAIRDGPHFVVFVHDQRSRLYADGQFVHDLVRLTLISGSCTSVV